LNIQQQQHLSSLIGNAIVTTAVLCNEISIQTDGKFILPEEDYLLLVKDFQTVLSKRLMPVKSSLDVKEEARKFVKDLVEKYIGSEDESSTIPSGVTGVDRVDPGQD
jgi:hypothetical protein